MSFLLLDLTLPTLAANLALDEALLLEAEAGTGGEVLRFWEWPRYAVVLGAGARIALDVNEPACSADGIPIMRRASGGGTVLLGRGCFLFSLVLRYERAAELRHINASYRYILDRMATALLPVANSIEHAGVSDLAIAGRKCSGNAQQRKREYLLHHGTLLYDFDLPLISRYLHSPTRQPSYRAQRAHDDFVMNLSSDSETLKRLIRSEWQADGQLTHWPEGRVEALVRDKYERGDWNERQLFRF
jgi:lipoate---protein ligase